MVKTVKEVIGGKTELVNAPNDDERPGMSAQEIMEFKASEKATNPIKPSPALLCKLGSIIVHVQEGRSPDAHYFDWHTVDVLMADPDVQDWLAVMDGMAMLPKVRKT